MADIDSLVISIDAKSEGAAQKIRELTKALADLRANVASGAIGDNLAKIANGISSIKLSKSVPTNLKAVVDIVENISDKALDNLDRMTTSLQRLSGVNLSGLRGAVKLAGEQQETGKQGEDESDKNKLPPYDPYSQSAKDWNLRFLQQLHRMDTRNVTALSSAFDGLFNSIERASAGLAGFLKQRIGAAFQGMIAPVKNLASKITGLASSFKRIIMYRAIRAIIKEITKAFTDGVNHVYLWSNALDKAGANNFAKNMDSAASSVLYLKNSLGAAVAPLLNALIPAFNALIDKVVEAINWINQLFAALSGASVWTKAKKKAIEYTAETKKAGGAAKEALRYLLPFDELNILPDDKKGGGGGSDTSGWEDAFETVDLDASKFDVVSKIKEAIKNGDWMGAGQLLAEELNKMVDQFDSYGFGEKVGNKINDGIDFALGFLQRFEFGDLGYNIGEFISGALNSINFERAGATYTRFHTSLLDLIIGAVEGMEETQGFAALGNSISSFIKGALWECDDWFKGYNWKKFGGVLFESLSQFFSSDDGFDAAGVATALFSAIGTAIGSGWSILKGFLDAAWSKLKVDVNDYFEKKTEEVGGNAVKGFAKGVADAAIEIFTLRWVKDNVVYPFSDSLFEALGIPKRSEEPSEEFKKAGKCIITGLKVGIASSPINRSWWLSNVVNRLIDDFAELLGINSPSTVFEGFGINIIEGLKKGLEDTWGIITGFFEQAWASLLNWWSNLTLPPLNADQTQIEVTYSTTGHEFTGGGTALDNKGKKKKTGHFATGGFPEDGLFFANSGELVGKFSNGRTAVANNAQIVAGISEGVADANENVVTAIYSAATQMINAIRESGGSGDVDWDYVAKRVSRAQRSQARAMGV